MGYARRYTVTTTAQSVMLSGGHRILIRVTGADVQLGYSEGDFSTGDYFTLVDGNTFVFDPPQLINELVYLQTGAGSATVELWVMGA
jgi:hypothetical protein